MKGKKYMKWCAKVKYLDNIGDINLLGKPDKLLIAAAWGISYRSMINVFIRYRRVRGLKVWVHTAEEIENVRDLILSGGEFLGGCRISRIKELGDNFYERYRLLKIGKKGEFVRGLGLNPRSFSTYMSIYKRIKEAIGNG